jgi:hypothetical protein
MAAETVIIRLRSSIKILKQNSYFCRQIPDPLRPFDTFAKIPFVCTKLSVYFANDPVQCPHRGLFSERLGLNLM